MRGISEKTLQQKLESLLSYQEDHELLKELIEECQELNPWIPLEEFLKSGFEGKCWVFWGKHVVATEYDTNGFWFDYRYPDQNTITHVQPIHKPEPPR